MNQEQINELIKTQEFKYKETYDKFEIGGSCRVVDV